MEDGVIEVPQDRYVLCVDDDPEFLKSLECFLPGQIQAGAPSSLLYRCLFQTDPRNALELLKELVDDGQTVVMVITDQKMPQMKGTELLAQVQELSPETIRVLLTGHAGIDSAIMAINQQLLDKYLTKPIENEHDFALSVQHLVERYEMQAHIRQQTKTLQGLYEFSDTLNGIATLDGTLDYIASFTLRVLRCRQVCFLTNADGFEGRETLSALSPGMIQTNWRLPSPAESRRLIRSQRAEWAAGLEAIPGFGLESGVLDSAPFPAPVVYAPLTSEGHCLGFLCAGGREDGSPFNEADRDALGCIASTASIALYKQLSRARLEDAYAETRAYAISLARANTRLQMLDRLKSDCLAFVSHELRTPLNFMAAIKLLGQDDDPAEQARMIHIVREGYERLERFIVKGLEYLDWFSTDRVLSPETADVVQAVHRVTQKLKGGNSRAVDLELSLPGVPCLARMSREGVEDLVCILVDNAVKFSGERIWIRIEVSESAGRILLQVSDRGRGFPTDLASELFRPFTIADVRHHREGSALSLAKAAAMVESHAGRIWAHSPGPDHGATFTVELPSATASSQGDAAPPAPSPRPGIDPEPTGGAEPDRAAA